MRIVSNTGPIIGLAKIGKLSLLASLAEEIFIPPLVYRELWGKRGSEAEAIEEAFNRFIRIKEMKPLDLSVEMAIANLDEGEKQAIGLASTFSTDTLLLLDDRAGRKIAQLLNIPSTGLIGVLLLAKEKGLVENVGALLRELKYHGYWLSDQVIAVAMQLAGEA
jgi:hypothetical protein